MTNPTVLPNRYKPDYEGHDTDWNKHHWVVTGPGVYYICDSRNEAYTLAAMMNAAYLCGYADSVFKDQNENIQV
jgi:hypothetical protein